MRILHTADWHLGKTLEGRSRLSEQADVLDEINTIVKDEQIDAIVMAGDAFDTVNPPALAGGCFMKACLRLATEESARSSSLPETTIILTVCPPLHR